MRPLEFTKTHPDFGSRLLNGIAPADAKIILDAARRRHFHANSVVVNQGHPADHLYLISKGRARYFFSTENGEKLLLYWLTPGEIFGGASLLLTPSPYLVSTETVKDSEILVWDRATIRSLCARFPRLIENALLISMDYLTWCVAAHVALVNHTARERLAGVLKYLAETIGQRVANGFEFDATNEELASAANVTQFTASRLMREWQDSNAVVKRRGKVLLRSPERLFLHSL
jgi:CRP/FNR family transcriptional regulator, nitrogen oxide reductase regulator